MDLSTTYLGLELAHPLMPGASPLADDLDTVRQLEDAGAAAIVMRSLFEEQIVGEELRTRAALDHHAHSFPEALSMLPEPAEFVLGPDEYLEQVRRIRAAVGVPVIGSLNGTTRGGWLRYARLIEEAGAHALELNVFDVPTDPELDAAAAERRTLELVREVRRTVAIPVALKISPFYTALPSFARAVEAAGAAGLVLFNRFFTPDLAPESLEVVRRLDLSTSEELGLRLRWLGILASQVHLSLGVTGGVHTAADALKAVMAGAHAVQMVSALIQHGPEHIAQVRRDLTLWLIENDYASLRQAQGSMSFARCPDPAAYARANYVRMVQG